MPILKLFLFFLWVVLMPILVGLSWSVKGIPSPSKGRGHFHIFLAYFDGIFIILALFEILAIPMVFLKCSLRQLSALWAILTLVIAAYSVRRGSHLSSKIIPLFSRLKARVSPLFLAVWLCIFLQAAYVTVNQHIDDDDAFYVATAVTAVETDTLMEYNPYTGELYKNIPARYVLASWPLYLAVLSTLCAGLHPTLIAHLLLPGLIVLFAYLIYARIAQELFPDDYHRQDLFLLIVALVISFSGFSIYSSGVFLITRGWQGKALVAAVIQPALFYLCRQAMRQSTESPDEKADGKNTDSPGSETDRSNQEKSFPENSRQARLSGLPSHENNRVSWFLLFCAVTTACMFSSMGVVLSVIPVGVYALVYGISQKEWKLFPRALLSCVGALMCGVIYLLL